MVRSKKSDPLFWAFGFPISIWKWEKCHTSPLTIHTANLSLFDSSPFQSGILPAPPFAFRFSAATHWVAVETPLQGADFFCSSSWRASSWATRCSSNCRSSSLTLVISSVSLGFAEPEPPKKCSTYSLHRFPKQWIFGNIRNHIQQIQASGRSFSSCFVACNSLLGCVSSAKLWEISQDLKNWIHPTLTRSPPKKIVDFFAYGLSTSHNCGPKITVFFMEL